MTVASSTIRSNASSGVQLEGGAHGVFNNTNIDWNGTNPSQPGMGIVATGAHVVVNAGNVIAHNREDGIQAAAAPRLC